MIVNKIIKKVFKLNLIHICGTLITAYKLFRIDIKMPFALYYVQRKLFSRHNGGKKVALYTCHSARRDTEFNLFYLDIIAHPARASRVCLFQ